MRLDFLSRDDPSRLGICFDPATLAMIGISGSAATTIGGIATIAQPVLGVMSALSAVGGAKAQSAELKRQGREQRLAGNLQAEKMRRDARLRQSRDRASMAEGGALSGTASGVLTQNATAYELDALTTEYQGEQAGRSSDYQAAQAAAGASPLRVFSAAISGFSDIDPLNLSPNGGAGGAY